MKIKRTIGGLVAGTTLAVAAFGSAAGADPADDLAIIVENAPAAVEAVPPVLQAIVDTYLETESTMMAASELMLGTMNITGALFQGTEQFAMVPLGAALAVGGVLTGVQPVLEAIDDPDLLADLIDPDDLSAILDQAPGTVPQLSDHLTIAVIEGLQGNITAGTGLSAGLGTPATIGNVFTGTANAIDDIFRGTTWSGLGMAYRVTVAVAAIASAGYVQDVEDGLAPVFEALAPVTAPLVVALGG